MKSIFSSFKFTDPIHQKVHSLMEALECEGLDGKTPWGLPAHLFIEHEYNGIVNIPRSIFRSLPYETWPEELVRMSHEKRHWPQDSHYFYSMEKILSFSKVPVMLYFGYAIYGEKLIPTAFFVVLQLTLRLEGLDDLFSEEWVIDPTAHALGIKPEGYIGVQPNSVFVKEWLESGCKTPHPLDTYTQAEKTREASPQQYSGGLSLWKFPLSVSKKPVPKKKKAVATEVNKKLKGIYFHWLKDVYEGSFPRSWDDTFEHYLQFTRYDFDEAWQKRIIAECGLSSRKKFDDQMILVKKDWDEYERRQSLRFEKNNKKKLNKMYARCKKEGILPF